MISKKNLLLYAAYTFTCLEDRAWSFFVKIVLESLGGMYFVSIGQFSESLLQMVFGGVLGQLIDRISRRNAIIMVVLLNNFSILLAASFLMTEVSDPFILYNSIFFCAVNRLFLNAEKSIIARDWMVALNEKETLARQNATLTGFDQLLNVLSPIAVGTLITSHGISQTLFYFAIGSMVSLTSKFVFLYLTYSSNPSLKSRQYKTLDQDKEPLILPIISSKSVPRSCGVFSTYFNQTTFFAAFGMTLFYKTVMGFDNLAVGYATTSSDLSIFTIGALKSYGAVAGMIGVISYAFLEKRFGFVRAGYVGLVVQQLLSFVALLTIWMPGSPMNFSGTPKQIEEGPSVLIFLIAIATSRFGLWCLDMAVTHSMQIYVPESERNTVFGFHMALCQTFSVPKEMLVIEFPQSSHFALYIISSYFCVTLGQFYFWLYARKVVE
uniref:Solute carrier family 40 member n=1 Tax=Caenorhabditis tropicalis TaxID=1561998 RepID=A0A1I7TY44_9PELO